MMTGTAAAPPATAAAARGDVNKTPIKGSISIGVGGFRCRYGSGGAGGGPGMLTRTGPPPRRRGRLVTTSRFTLDRTAEELLHSSQRYFTLLSHSFRGPRNGSLPTVSRIEVVCIYAD